MKRSAGKWIAYALTALTVAASVLLVQSLEFLQETPFSLTRAWDTPSAVAVAENGVMAVVENSRMLVSITDTQGRLAARIRGGSFDTDAFYYAEHIATDGQSIVIAEVRHAESSTFVQSERILQYDLSGNRIAELYAVAYAPENRPRQLGRIRSLKMTDGRVTFAWVDGAQVGASLCQNGEEQTLVAVTLPGDGALRAAWEPVTQTLCFSTKKGALGQCGRDGDIRWQAFGDGLRVPWSVDLTPGGTWLVSELSTEQVLALSNETTPPQLLFDGGLVYELTAAGEGAAFTDGQTVLVLAPDGSVRLASDTVTLSPGYGVHLGLTWVSAAYLLVAFGWLSLRLLRLMRGQPVSPAKRHMLIISASVLVTVIVVMAFLLSFAQRQMQSLTMGALSQLCESISATSGTVFGDKLARIQTLQDYGGEDYRHVRSYMDAFCDASYHNGSNLYYILYRFDETMLYGVMDYENTTGARFPYSPLAGTLYGDVLRTGRQAQVEGEANIYGMWSYAIAPVYGSAGDTVGLLEIGTNQYGEVVARQTLIRGVLIGVLVALMMAMLAFNEITAYHDHLGNRRFLRSQHDGRLALGFIRPLIFLVFLADNLDAAYIPQLSADLGSLTGGVLPLSLASALPMSLQLLAIGLSALVCGRLLDRSHPRAVLLTGFLLQLAGAGLAVGAIVTGEYWLLVCAKGVGGFGTGAAVVTCNALPARTDDGAEQQGLIAGLNVGVITGVVLGSSIGGFVADYAGYPAAYAFSGLCILAAAALSLHSLHGSDTLTLPQAEGETRPTRGNALRFLRTPRVLGFLLCVMFPFMLMMYFKDYLFPLFAASLGKTESVIGSVMLLGGALAIFLGDVLPGALLRRLGAWSAVRLANVVSVYALLLFAFHPQFETAIVTVCLLGVSASFGYASQGVYYTDLIRSGGIGDGQAMGLFSLFDNLGQTSGPLGLGALLFMGVAAESGAIALGAAALIGVATLAATRGKGRAHRGD